MKRNIVIAIFLLSVSVLYAQNDSFYKHEIRVAHGDAFVTSELRLERDVSFRNYSLSYFYRPKKFFWVGVNFVNYFGEKTYYNWREYYTDGSFEDFSKSKTKNATIVAPEIRLSSLNRNGIILYGALSGGVGYENGYDDRNHKYPNFFPALHLTIFGLRCNFGKNKNIFLGSELGVGFKGLGSLHAGYRF